MTSGIDGLLHRVLLLPESERIAFAKSLQRTVCLLGVEIRLNDNEPLRCFSNLPGGINVHLYVEDSGLLELVVRHKTDTGRSDYVLNNIQPGDVLRLSVGIADPERPEDSCCTMERCSQFSKRSTGFTFKDGCRIALEATFESGQMLRIACPDRGYFELIMSDGPFAYLRVAASAGKTKERWHWQLPDMHPDNTMKLKIIESDSSTLYEQIR